MAALSAAVTVLYRASVAHFSDVDVRLRECEKDRADLWKAIRSGSQEKRNESSN